MGGWVAAGNDPEALRLKYSGLFEVGDDGPPVPIREDLFLAQPAKLREDLVRFYDYFGYQLDEEFQWQMDHLSIELEFMHFLIIGELRSDNDELSFQLGQVDFLEKHLINWVPLLSKKLSTLDESDIYTKIVIELEEFLLKDQYWHLNSKSYLPFLGSAWLTLLHRRSLTGLESSAWHPWCCSACWHAKRLSASSAVSVCAA